MTFEKNTKTQRRQGVAHHIDKNQSSRRTILAAASFRPLQAFLKRVRETMASFVPYKDVEETIARVDRALEDFLRNRFLAEAEVMSCTVTPEQEALGMTVELKKLLKKIALLMPVEIRRTHYEDVNFDIFLSEIEVELKRADVRYSFEGDARMLQYYYMVVYNVLALRPSATHLDNFLDTFMEIIPQVLVPEDNSKTLDFNLTNLMEALTADKFKGNIVTTTQRANEETDGSAAVAAEAPQTAATTPVAASTPRYEPMDAAAAERLPKLMSDVYAAFSQDDDTNMSYEDWVQKIKEHNNVAIEYPILALSKRSNYVKDMDKGWFGAETVMSVMKHVQSLPDFDHHFNEYLTPRTMANLMAKIQKKLAEAGFKKAKDVPYDIRYFETVSLTYFFTMYELNIVPLPVEGVIGNIDDLSKRLAPQTHVIVSALTAVLSHFVRHGDVLASEDQKLQNAVQEIVVEQLRELNNTIVDKNSLESYINTTPAETQNSSILKSEKDFNMLTSATATPATPETRTELEIRVDEIIARRSAEAKAAAENRNKQVDEAFASMSRSMEELTMRQDRHENRTNDRLVNLERQVFGNEGVAIVERIRSRAWATEHAHVSTDLTTGEKVALGSMAVLAAGGIGYAAYSYFGNDGQLAI